MSRQHPQIDNAHQLMADRASPSLSVPEGDGAVRPWYPAWYASLLRVPLLPKLIVADLVVNLLTFVALRDVPAQLTEEVFIVALLVTMLVNGLLVWWALRPLRLLELTATRVSEGDLGARVPESRYADRNIERIGRTLNVVLNHLMADRERARQLASQVISAGDQERAHIGRELHDSTAQSLSALEMLVTASLRESAPGALHERLDVMRELVVDTLSEVRTLSHNVHPRVLDDLGLPSALESLARRTREGTGIVVRVSTDMRAEVSPPVASVLYRVAQEAIRNAVRHSDAREVTLSLYADQRQARLETRDDGKGFDVSAAESAAHGMGLFLMRERLALVDGRLDIDGFANPGARLTATVPVPIAALAPSHATPTFTPSKL
jgi:signal transduction histidine kinase